VVATAVGGVGRLVRDGVNGLLVPPGDAAALARAVERLLADPALAARLATAGQEAARPLTRHAQVRGVKRFLAGAYPGAPFAARLGT
jgi:glycosyltransferase involved in cell wall biosynthesis